MTNARVQFVTPLPPLASGIAQYSRDLLLAVSGQWPLNIVGEAGSESYPAFGTSSLQTFKRGIPTIFQIGNSGFHRLAFQHARTESGILVLHDVVLHHGRAGELLRSRGGSSYLKLMRERYGNAGAEAVRDILAGRDIVDIGAFPLSEDYVERARVTVVHSEYARGLVEKVVPGAKVVVVPMGIPLPALVDQASARRALGLPEGAFVVASITHVNPFKRLPVVLRAMRRFIAREPNAILVVAGSVAPGIDLRRQVSLLNLDRNVRLLGYVTDDHARLVARAADACINLRYPSAGETSASLLRLLGAGRPVIVTDDAPMAEYPRNAVVPVPVDRFEDEMIAEVMFLLAQDERLRLEAGNAARAFIEQEHNLETTVLAYRAVVRKAFSIDLPKPEGIELHEAPPADESNEPQVPHSRIDGTVADALSGLHLSGHDATIRTAAVALTDLKLHDLTVESNDWKSDEPVSTDPKRTAGHSGVPDL